MMTETRWIKWETSEGIGLSARSVTRNYEVPVLTAEEFDARAARSRPTRHHSIGLNAGAPADGLEVWSYTGDDPRFVGERYLVDCRGFGSFPVAMTVEPNTTELGIFEFPSTPIVSDKGELL